MPDASGHTEPGTPPEADAAGAPGVEGTGNPGVAPSADAATAPQGHADTRPRADARDAGREAPVRVLLADREPFPTFRPEVLFQCGTYLPRMGVKTTLATFEDKGGRNGSLWTGGGGLILWRLAHRGRLARHLLFGWSLLRLLMGELRRHDVFIARDLPFWSLPALIACRLARKPFIYWMTFPYPEDDILRAKVQAKSLGTARRLYLLLRGAVTWVSLYKIIAPLADNTIVISRELGEALMRRGAPREAVTVNPIAIDPALVKRLGDTPARDPRLEGKQVLAYLGSLDRTRGIDFFCEVLASLRRSGHDAVLLLVGDAPEEADTAWLMERARQEGVAEHVVLTGWLPREEALRRMADADVGVVTFPEHFVFRISSPTKTVEYMALGIPVVAGNNPDGEELVQQSGAGLTAPRDPDAFAAAVARILDDPALAREMGERGRTFIHEERDYRKQSAELAAMLRRLLRRGDDSAN